MLYKEKLIFALLIEVFMKRLELFFLLDSFMYYAFLMVIIMIDDEEACA